MNSFYGKFMVSIPCRYAKNWYRLSGHPCPDGVSIPCRYAKNVKLLHLSLTPSQFQSLVGTLKTRLTSKEAELLLCFNPL